VQAKKGLVEEAAGGFWNLLVARGLVWIGFFFFEYMVWIGLEGKGGTAKPTRAKVRGVTLNIHRPFEIQRSSLAWSARLGGASRRTRSTAASQPRRPTGQ